MYRKLPTDAHTLTSKRGHVSQLIHARNPESPVIVVGTMVDLVTRPSPKTWAFDVISDLRLKYEPLYSNIVGWHVTSTFTKKGTRSLQVRAWRVRNCGVLV